MAVDEPASTARSTSPTALWWRSSSASAIVADRRPLGVVAATDREQELVLRGRDADRRRLLLAPVQETAQPRAEFEQLTVVGIVGFEVGHEGIS